MKPDATLSRQMRVAADQARTRAVTAGRATARQDPAAIRRTGTSGLIHVWSTYTPSTSSIHVEDAMAPNKTLYIRDEDEPLWDRAELVAKRTRQSVSQLVTASLRSYLPTIHTPDDQMEDIRVRVGDRVQPLHDVPSTWADYSTTEAFTGRWLVPPGEEAQSRHTLQDHPILLRRRTDATWPDRGIPLSPRGATTGDAGSLSGGRRGGPPGRHRGEGIRRTREGNRHLA